MNGQIHWSAVTLEPQRDSERNKALVKQWDTLSCKWTVNPWSCQFLKQMCWKQEKWGLFDDKMTGSNNGQLQNGLACAVQWLGPAKGKYLLNWWQVHGCSRLTDTCRERRLASLIWFHRNATVAQTGKRWRTETWQNSGQYYTEHTCPWHWCECYFLM